MKNLTPKNQPVQSTIQNRFSLRQAIATPLLLAAIFTTGHIATTSAQDVDPGGRTRAGQQTRASQTFRTRRDDVPARILPNGYQANPVSNDRLPTDYIMSNTESSTVKVESTSGVSDMVGTTSVEDFQGTQATLYNTHESADGFRNYFNTWYTANFGRRDTAVSVWQFHDFASYNYDLWNSGGTDYGADGVRVMWHSGHGGMSSPNNFFAPMGANWASNGWNARSSNMALGGNYNSYGDERLRYLFWDTCNSVMISGGNNPYSTWGVRSKGIRMVFGYETTSIDSPNYGKYFWEEWNKGKSLSTAFLDASWRINTKQSPAVVAFGANQTEATDRLYNERYLYAGAASNNWGQWRWYNARTIASVGTVSTEAAQEGDNQTQSLRIPTQARAQQVAEQGNSNNEFVELSKSLGIQIEDEGTIQERPMGLRAVKTDRATMVVEKNGNFEVFYETANDVTVQDSEVSDAELINRANEVAKQLSVLKGQQFRASMIRDTQESGGFEGFTDHTRTIEKTIIIDQLINGVPFIDAEAGHLEVTFDARSGQTKRLRSSLRHVTASVEGEAVVTETTLEQVRQTALKNAAGAPTSEAASTLELVPDSEAIGYQIINGKATPVYRAMIKDAKFSLNRPQEVIVPLVKTN